LIPDKELSQLAEVRVSWVVNCNTATPSLFTR